MSQDLLPLDQIAATVSATSSDSRWSTCTRTCTRPRFGTPVPNATGKTDPAGLMLWGVDELVTYHYLVAEVYRVVPRDEAAVRAVLADEQDASRPTTSGSTCSSSGRRSARRAAAC